MKIIQRKEVMDNFQNTLGLNWYAYLMTGEVPATINDVAFDITDTQTLSEQAACIAGITYVVDVENFSVASNFWKKVRSTPTSGTDEYGNYITPQAVQYSGRPSDAAVYSLMNDDDAYLELNANHVGDYFEITFATPIQPSRIVFKQHPNWNYCISTVDIQAHDGNDWVDVLTDQGMSVGESIIDNAVFTQAYDRFRIVLKGDAHSSYPTYAYFMQFYVDTLPTDAELGLEDKTITWAILAPAQDILDGDLGTIAPRILEEVGGPSDLKNMTIRKGTMSKGEHPVVMYHKMQFNDLEEV